MKFILQAGQYHANKNVADEHEEESLQRMYTSSNDIWLWDLVA